MKKTCNGCRAVNGDFCMLGFKTHFVSKFLKPFNVWISVMTPLEQCPKPRTYNEYFLQDKLDVKEKHL